MAQAYSKLLNENYEYFSPADNECFNNQNNNEQLTKLNNIIKKMVVSEDEKFKDLFYSASNNYILDPKAIGQNISQERYESSRATCGLKVFKVIDYNTSTSCRRNVDQRGSISPIDNAQTSYVAVPLVYIGANKERRENDPFRYESEDEQSEFAWLYPPQWEVVRRNYPDFSQIIDTAITKRQAQFFGKKMYYSNSKNSWFKCDPSRLKELSEFIADKYYKDKVINQDKQY